LEKVIPERIAEIVKGIAIGAAKAGVALVGGETAEHPGLLEEDEFDIAGAATGGDRCRSSTLVQIKYKAVTSSSRCQRVVYMPNGYSLVRPYLGDSEDLDLDTRIEALSKTVGEVLLTPTVDLFDLSTRLTLYKAMQGSLPTGSSHITGGGIAENTARVRMPGHLNRATYALIYLGGLPGGDGRPGPGWGVPQADMERTWNCGIGMSAFVAPHEADRALRTLAAREMKAWVAGVIGERTGSAGSALVGRPTPIIFGSDEF
jgi:phosphoribosylformylglycinamidine cyclo-ligase